jgi:hypothetical protein
MKASAPLERLLKDLTCLRWQGHDVRFPALGPRPWDRPNPPLEIELGNLRLSNLGKPLAAKQGQSQHIAHGMRHRPVAVADPKPESLHFIRCQHAVAFRLLAARIDAHARIERHQLFFHGPAENAGNRGLPSIGLDGMAALAVFTEGLLVEDADDIAPRDPVRHHVP